MDRVRGRGVDGVEEEGTSEKKTISNREDS